MLFKWPIYNEENILYISAGHCGILSDCKTVEGIVQNSQVIAYETTVTKEQRVGKRRWPFSWDVILHKIWIVELTNYIFNFK